MDITELGDLRAPPSSTTEGKFMPAIGEAVTGLRVGDEVLGVAVGSFADFRRLIDGNSRGKIAVTLVQQGAVG